MPVRIYDISKKLGLDNKDIIAKAKSLGIAAARVPSSSLDKISAEWLEGELFKDHPELAAKFAPPPPAPEIPKPAPEEKIVVITPPAPEPKPEVKPEPAVVKPKVENGEAALAPPPVEAPKVAPPPKPAVPKIGEKVGFVQLPPSRPQPAREREQGRGRFPSRQGAPQQRDQRGGRQQFQRGRDGRPQQQPSREPAKPAPAPQPKFVAPAGGEVIIIKPPIVVRELAAQLKQKPFKIIADLMELGVFANVNQAIDEKIAQQICAKHGFRFEVEKRERGAGAVHAVEKKVELDIEDKPEDLKPRAPVVTIMGHVDHGKTSLLDVIRKANVAAGESGGITQHIGAYTISVPHPEKKKGLAQITFLDTPGHAAFSSMRARGANVTDIVVLVVAANDGVMPQTLEALNHAKEAKVPILVAVNKIDHPNANPMRVRQQLQDKGLVPDDWGGETIFVDVSALTKQGVDKLLEMILLQAELLELKANPNRRAKGNVIESGVEPGGPTATVLVRKGTLRVGQIILCGEFYGRVRALINEEGVRLKEAA
ncbi:MAG: translation initiation factor IF-2, partial [Limisphaerales bacterium]